MSTVTTKQFSQCPQAIHAHIHLHGKVKKCDFVNISEVINSFFLDYEHNVSHLIIASLKFRDFFCIPKFAKLTCRENIML